MYKCWKYKYRMDRIREKIFGRIIRVFTKHSDAGIFKTFFHAYINRLIIVRENLPKVFNEPLILYPPLIPRVYIRIHFRIYLLANMCVVYAFPFRPRTWSKKKKCRTAETTVSVLFLKPFAACVYDRVLTYCSNFCYPFWKLSAEFFTEKTGGGGEGEKKNNRKLFAENIVQPRSLKNQFFVQLASGNSSGSFPLKLFRLSKMRQLFNVPWEIVLFSKNLRQLLLYIFFTPAILVWDFLKVYLRRKRWIQKKKKSCMWRNLWRICFCCRVCCLILRKGSIKGII